MYCYVFVQHKKQSLKKIAVMFFYFVDFVFLQAWMIITQKNIHIFCVILCRPGLQKYKLKLQLCLQSNIIVFCVNSKYTELSWLIHSTSFFQNRCSFGHSHKQRIKVVHHLDFYHHLSGLKVSYSPRLKSYLNKGCSC